MDILANLLAAPAKGKPAATAVVERELEAGDLEVLARERKPAPKQRLARVREVHHNAARLLAAGWRSVDVALATGLDPTRIRQLKGDPAFQELVEFYTNREDQRFVEVRERLKSVGLVATEELLQRLLDDPEQFTVNALVETVKATLDRAGHGPVSKKESVELKLTGEELARMKAEAQVGEVIDVETAMEALPASGGADEGGAGGGPGVSETSPRTPSEGSGV